MAGSRVSNLKSRKGKTSDKKSAALARSRPALNLVLDKRGAEVHSNIGLRDVARVAGVSTATVSRAVNDPELVSEELRTRINSVIRHFGWVPSGAARALA